MKVVVIEPCKMPDVKELSSPIEYLDLQKIVGGYIEHVIANEMRGFDIWINEEGKLCGLAPNFTIFNGCDVIVGTAVITKTDDEGNTIGLTDEEVEELLKKHYGDIDARIEQMKKQIELLLAKGSGVVKTKESTAKSALENFGSEDEDTLALGEGDDDDSELDFTVQD